MSRLKFLSKEKMLHVERDEGEGLARSYVISIESLSQPDKDVIGCDLIKDYKDVDACTNEEPDC